jgi:MarR family transcriptional regulator, transcriptional regulator for hemolysin
MEIERATTGRLIDRLEAKGWVTRRSHETDRRINRIYLTPEAERIHKRIWKIAKATVNDAMVDLSIEEAVQLLDLLGRMKNRLIDNVEQPAVQRRRPAAKRAPQSAKRAASNPIDDAEPITIDDGVVIT